MKKAFTLSEALVTLAILGVLAAILIPVVDNVRPDKDKITYKKALYTLQTAVSDATDGTLYQVAANYGDYWRDANIKSSDFCNAVAESLNTAGTVNCDIPTGQSSYDNPNFVTTDGIRYWGLEGTFGGLNRTIYVDRALSTGELRNIADKRERTGDGTGLKIQVRYDGKVHTPDPNAAGSLDYGYENELIESSLQVSAGAMN